MPETTENYHRIPVSSGHGSHEIRTITVDSGRGIKALYCTDCKEIVTYLFDTDKWTMEEAKEWVESHKGMGTKIMSTKFDRRTKDKIGSNVRYKSYGTFVPKGAGGGDSDEMLVRGFFTSDLTDEVGDIITKEATDKAIEKWRMWGNIRTMHDYPSGRVERIGEADGLEWNEVVTIPVDETTKKLIAGGVLKAYSVGIIPRKYELNEDALSKGDEEDMFFLPLIIHEYDMVEISYVDHPANYSATISDVSEGKMADFGQRAVVFKNLEVSGESSDMNKDVDAETDVADVEEEEVEDVEEEAAEDTDVNDEPAAESKDIDDEGSDNEDDDDTEPEPNVFQAVQNVEVRLGSLEEGLTQVADKLDGFVDEMVSAFMEALSESGKSIVSSETPDETPDEVDKGKTIDVDAMAEQISKGVLEGLVEALKPDVVRSAHVAVDGEEDSEDEPGDQTVKYMAMTPSERRAKIKDILEKSRQ